MTLTVLAIMIGLLFAMNIGASGAASSMGIAYGSGILKKKIGIVAMWNRRISRSMAWRR